MKPYSILLFIIFAFVTGCGDMLAPTKKIPGSYYLLKSETGSYWSLYYDIGGAGHGRADSVDQIGWTDRYIFIENDNYYYLLDKRKDSAFLNADEIVLGPFYQDQFMLKLDSLKIKDSFSFRLNLADK